MALTTRLVPCFDSSAACSLDWAGIAAIGGWVAAAVTALAVGVALFVGIAPVVMARSQRARVGRAEARVAAVDLGLQALHVGAGLKLLAGDEVPAHVFAVATAQFQVLNCETCKNVVPFLDCLPAQLEQPLASAIANMAGGIRALSQIPKIDQGRVNTVAVRLLYGDVLLQLEAGRQALASAVGQGYLAEPLEPATSEMANKLKQQATSLLLDRLKNSPQQR